MTSYPFRSLSIIQIYHSVFIAIQLGKKAKISGSYLWAGPTDSSFAILMDRGIVKP